MTRLQPQVGAGHEVELVLWEHETAADTADEAKWWSLGESNP